MPLPVGKLGTDTVTIDGTDISIRSLSWNEAMGLDAFQPDRRAEAPAYIIEKGTGATADEVQAFLDSHKLEEALKLVEAILTLSGLDDTFRARITDSDRTRSSNGRARPDAVLSGRAVGNDRGDATGNAE
jgi:hypothetical protein